MESHFEINVALKSETYPLGKHLFATAPRSITNKEDLEKVYAIFKKKFPASEGYILECTYWEVKGGRITLL